MSSPQRVIRRPLAQRWRDVRLRFVPLAIYVAGVTAIVYLWNSQWMPSTFTGEVQAPLSNVASPIDGSLVDVPVRQFSRVTKGQVLGKVMMSPAAAAAGLAAIRAELQVMQARMTLEGHRIDQNYQQLRVDLLKQKVDVEIARSKLIFAAGELARVEQLRKERIASQFEYDAALRNRDAAQAEVKERTALIGETEKVLASMKAEFGGGDNPMVSQTINAAIAAQEEQFKLLKESTLRAPIEGVVSKIWRLNGENIKGGEPLITISGDNGESIIGFVRQPLSFDPKVGDKVVVRTRRGVKREASEAQILQIGGRLEFFAQSLRVRGFDSSQERGLPVLITIPENLKLHPGELVDLALKN